jgi:hypothetical protein
VSGESGRSHRAGDAVDDLCRACKLVRRHTVVAAGTDGAIHRVVCDYCGSQHNYRGGGRRSTPSPRSTGAPPSPTASPERSENAMDDSYATPTSEDLESLLRRVIREEAGLTPAAPAEKWRGGELVLRPGREGLQEKTWPVESFFHKVVMIRNRLRVLEQQINGADIPDDLKVKLQGYVTACYGSLTSFNVLFADEADRFRGSSG